MIIERGNIKLVRLTEDYIELVRQWRNAPEIQSTMEYREYITHEMQKKWFASINNINNDYLLIQANNIFIGLISATGIDWEHNITNNGGIFIWNKNYHESTEVISASILLTDLGFYLGMEKNYIRILNDNKRSITYNRSMGYELLPGQDSVYNQKYILTAAAYFKATDKVRRFFDLTDNIKFTVDADEYPFYNERLVNAAEKSKNYLSTTSIEIAVS